MLPAALERHTSHPPGLELFPLVARDKYAVVGFHSRSKLSTQSGTPPLTDYTNGRALQMEDLRARFVGGLRGKRIAIARKMQGTSSVQKPNSPHKHSEGRLTLTRLAASSSQQLGLEGLVLTSRRSCSWGWTAQSP